MGKIRWTEKSSTHLMAIHDYIAKDSKTCATHFIKSLIKASSKLEVMPRCGCIVPEFETYEFREVIYKNYRNGSYRDDSCDLIDNIETNMMENRTVPSFTHLFTMSYGRIFQSLLVTS
jgi:plasmid stabilization system protein ParE